MIIVVKMSTLWYHSQRVSFRIAFPWASIWFLYLCEPWKSLKVIFFDLKKRHCLLFSDRYVYLGLSAVLRAPSYLLAILFFILIKRNIQNKNSKLAENGGREDVPMNKEDNCKNSEHLASSSEAEKESHT